MNNDQKPCASRLHDSAFQADLERTVQRVLWLHKAMNVPISSMKDGKLVIIQPEDIPVYENPFPKVQLSDPPPTYPPVSVPFTESL